MYSKFGLSVFAFAFLNCSFNAQLLPGQSPSSQTISMPHIVVILADDLGYGDPQCYNAESKIPTPHLNRNGKGRATLHRRPYTLFGLHADSIWLVDRPILLANSSHQRRVGRL